MAIAHGIRLSGNFNLDSTTKATARNMNRSWYSPALLFVGSALSSRGSF
jgi:hypothetical protein